MYATVRTVRTKGPAICVGHYGRLSVAHSNVERGLDRQVTDGVDIAAERGWEIVKWYEDRGKSASKRNVIRPDFLLALEDLRSGVIDGLVYSLPDRLTRRPKEMEALIELYEDCEAGGRKLVFATTEGDVRLDTVSGRYEARGGANSAKKESELTALRVTNEHRQKARLGLPAGPNAFGHKPGKTEVDPRAAATINDAVDMLLAGATISMICEKWNNAGMLTPRGNRWRWQTVKVLLTSPRLAGYRVYRGEIARDADGNPIAGPPAIIDVETWEKVCAVLTPSRIGKRRSEGHVVHLLSGIVRCGICTSRMVGSTHKKLGHIYMCPAKANGGCGRVAASGRHVDKFVVEMVLRKNAENNAAVESEQVPWDGAAELTDVLERLASLRRSFVKGELGAESAFPMIAELEAERDRLRADEKDWRRDQVETAGPRAAPEEWDDMLLPAQRVAILKVVEAVVIKPQTRRLGPRFDEKRLDIVPRQRRNG